ncbi:MAG: hypothetical protein ACE5DX_03455 [Candidatus Dojkabacteria bacterium]
MPFKERHEQIIKKFKKPPTPLQFWGWTIGFGVLVYAAVFCYDFIQSRTIDLFLINTQLALTGMYLIGFSFILSGLAFFWDFVDTKVVFRKYLGMVGYYLILVHVVFSFVNYFFVSNAPRPTFDSSWEWLIGDVLISNLWAFGFGLLAFLIFTIMALISNRYAALELGGVRWRQLLRVGYVAYFFVLIHFFLKRFEQWQAWLAGDYGKYPPQSLLLLVFILFVLLLRVALFVSVRRKQKERETDVSKDAVEIQ